MKVSIYVASENLQPRKYDRWSAYIIRAEGSEREVVKAVMKYSTANQATIGTIIDALDRFTRPAEITMYIDSDFVLGVIERHDGQMSTLEHWQENGWRTARKTEVKNRNDWQRLYNKLRVFEQSGGTFAFKSLGDEDPMGWRLKRVIRLSKTQEG